MSLLQKHCVPCEGTMPPLSSDAIATRLLELHKDWSVVENKKLLREFRFKDFALAMAFVNRVAEIAEQEGHHPDIAIHYNRVTIELWTHAISGLSENDFILAATIDRDTKGDSH